MTQTYKSNTYNLLWLVYVSSKKIQNAFGDPGRLGTTEPHPKSFD